jgi:hypothetical protein
MDRRRALYPLQLVPFAPSSRRPAEGPRDPGEFKRKRKRKIRKGIRSNIKIKSLFRRPLQAEACGYGKYGPL